MAGNTFGKSFRLTSFGESHGPAIGGIIDGCPAGLMLEERFILQELMRRKPGSGPASTQRKEDDLVEFLSGVFEGRTTGTPIGFIIRNKDHRPEDYEHLRNTYRPSHADYTYEKKYGLRDHRGGGRSSARETAVRVVAGAVAKLLLRSWSMSVDGFVSQIGSIKLDKPISSLDVERTNRSPIRCPDPDVESEMLDLIDKTKAAGDTLGGVVTCRAQGIPAGLGEPVYDKFEADLAKAIMSINAVKGFDLGSGIEAASMKGSEHNDRFIASSRNNIKTTSNHSGGVQGGLTNGQDIVFRAYFKPVATLMQDQTTVDNAGNTTTIKGKGRHDVCVVPRAVPIVEAMAAMTLVDFVLRNTHARLDSIRF